MIALADPRLRAEAVTRLDGGANSAVFEVRTNGGRALVVKVYSDLFHWKMQKEVFVYGLVRGHALAAPVPVVLAADDSKTLLLQNVLVLTKLEGGHVLHPPAVRARQHEHVPVVAVVVAAGRVQTAGKQILFACRDVALDPPAQLVVAAEVGELAQLLVELRPDWREALDLYVLYHRLELWDWLASLGQTDALDALADEMRLLTV